MNSIIWAKIQINRLRLSFFCIRQFLSELHDIINANKLKTNTVNNDIRWMQIFQNKTIRDVIDSLPRLIVTEFFDETNISASYIVAKRKQRYTVYKKHKYMTKFKDIYIVFMRS